MTAIYGLIRFDGAPLDERELRVMGDSIAYWGQDGNGTWVGDGAGLGQRVTYNTPESIHEKGPILCESGTVIVAAARLDNRDELLDTLDIERDRTATTDSLIVAEAFQKWGRAAPSHLYGDWAFAAWDPQSQRLFLARDHYGNTSLYYYRDVRSFAFGSSRKALLALPHVPRKLNELRLAQILVVWPTDGAATVHEDIFRLPPAHCLTVSRDRFAIERYWKLEEVPDVRLPSDEAYVERFLDLYSAAVETRLRSRRPVATTLSSGLDSGSVTALAARAMRSRGETLTAFTSVPLFPEIARILPRILTDEWPLAHAVSDWYGNIDHHAVTAEHMTPLMAMDRSLWLHDEPVFGAGNLHWMIELLEQCRDHGCGTLLTGQMGNGGVSWSGDQQRTVRSFLAGRWIEAFRGLRAEKRATSASWAFAARSQLVSPLRDMVSGMAFRRSWSSRILWTNRLIHFGFAERLRLVDRIRDSGFDPSFSRILGGRAQRMQIVLPEIHPVGALWNEMGSGHHLDVRDPTADARLLEFCTGIPDEQFAKPGQDRWLIRRSMEDLLPPQVQWNPRRGTQGTDLPLRFRADAVNVDQALAEITASPIANEYLDVPLLQQRWSSLQADLGSKAHFDASILARGLLAGRFLSRYF